MHKNNLGIRPFLYEEVCVLYLATDTDFCPHKHKRKKSFAALQLDHLYLANKKSFFQRCERQQGGERFINASINKDKLHELQKICYDRGWNKFFSHVCIKVIITILVEVVLKLANFYYFLFIEVCLHCSFDSNPKSIFEKQSSIQFTQNL